MCRVATQGSDPGTAAEGYSRSGLLCDQFKISLMLSLVSELCPPCLDRGGGDTSNAHGPVVCTGAVTRHPQNYWLRIWKRTGYWVRGCFVITTSDRDCLLVICNHRVCHVCLSLLLMLSLIMICSQTTASELSLINAPAPPFFVVFICFFPISWKIYDRQYCKYGCNKNRFCGKHSLEFL